MPTFKVTSGEFLETTVRAVTHKTAAIVAVNKERSGLDTLISVLRKGDPETSAVVFSSALILDAMECEAFTIEDQN